ncbi:TonB-dependent receptor, partial [Acinetobacter baumannii]|uniref:TonB-dependent receptor domain-containing protein n=1 Tax=Acinetobacter baumannii TaxID=470 RepID=UPI00331B1690
MGKLERGPVRAIAGVRVEHTDNKVRGNFVEQIEEGAIYNGVELEDDTVFVTPTSFKRNYTDVLPSAALRYEATESVLLRAGVYK